MMQEFALDVSLAWGLVGGIFGYVVIAILKWVADATIKRKKQTIPLWLSLAGVVGGIYISPLLYLLLIPLGLQLVYLVFRTKRSRGQK